MRALVATLHQYQRHACWAAVFDMDTRLLGQRIDCGCNGLVSSSVSLEGYRLLP